MDRIIKIFLMVVMILLSTQGSICFLFAVDVGSGTKKDLFVYIKEDIRDPFIPLLDNSSGEKIVGLSSKDTMQIKLRGIVLNGILWDQDKPLVLINNKIYKLGDLVNDLKIESIDADAVVFSYQGLQQKVSFVVEYDQ